MRRASIASKERHERACPGLDLLVKGFQGAFAADCITEQDGEKIDHLVPSEATTGKAHLLFNSCKHALVLEVVNQQSDFPEPGRNRGHRLRRGLDIHRG